MSKINFEEALKSKDLQKLKLIPKSDLHNHSARGANRSYFERKNNVIFPSVPIMHSIEKMDNWYDSNIGMYCSGADGFKERVKALFLQADNDNIKVFSPSFCFGMKKHFNDSFEEYIDFLKYTQKKYALNTIFLPEISVYRNLDPELTKKYFEECLRFDFFKSIDLIGDEKLGVDMYVDLYKEAKKHGYILKAHVGEFEGPSFIEDALDKLNLDEINHGISCVESKELMKYLSANNIILNICPSSNVYLSRVKNYMVHPISKIFQNGIKCTINSDDLLVFNQSVSEEYMNLYNNNVLGIDELNEIRETGLSYVKKIGGIK